MLNVNDSIFGGIGKVDDRLIILLDLEKILSAEGIATLEIPVAVN